jgi:hypothetical protein
VCGGTGRRAHFDWPYTPVVTVLKSYATQRDKTFSGGLSRSKWKPRNETAILDREAIFLMTWFNKRGKKETRVFKNHLLSYRYYIEVVK